MFVPPLARTASLVRSDPRTTTFEGLASRLLDTPFDRFLGGSDADAEVRTPAMDVAESDAAYTVTFDVPGTSRDQLKVSVEGRRVVLSTTTADAQAGAASPAPAADGQPSDPTADAAPSVRVLYRERRPARYARTVSLPAEVDQATSEAKFENGVLTLVLAKKVPAGATQLKIV